jgi:ATP-binding cassette subfamily C protein
MLASIGGIATTSIAVNLLMLNGSIYMMQVYDRVLTARSTATLLTLSTLMLGLYAAQGLLDAVRQRLAVRIATAFAEGLRAPAHAATMRLAATGRAGAAALPEQDVERVRVVLSGSGPSALLDLPFAPFFLMLIFAIHPLLGVVALAGAAVLLALPLLSGRFARRPAETAGRAALRRTVEAEAQRRNAETARAMGFVDRLRDRSLAAAETVGAAELVAADITGGFAAAARVTRMALQSVLLGVGAWLVIQDAVSAGAILASSVLVGRVFAPVDLAIANWRGLVEARAALTRLDDVLTAAPSIERTRLPAPVARLTVEGLTVTPPGAARPVVRGVDFALEAGDVLAIVGPSGAGKSSVARALVGLWTPTAGSVRLDGARLDQWEPEDLGRHIGWVPQSVGFFDASIAENIARLDPAAESDAVIAAARAAGIHELILRTEAGYDTSIGDAHGPFSTGQRQRLALARALYGDPFLLVLDEANSNLDSQGEAALKRAVADAKARGAIVVLVTHRSSLISAADHLLVVEDGAMKAFGRRDEIVRALDTTTRSAPRAA